MSVLHRCKTLISERSAHPANRTLPTSEHQVTPTHPRRSSPSIIAMTADHHRRARRASIHSLSLHAPRRNPTGGGLANPPISKVETPITNFHALPPTPPERTRTHGECERRQPTKSPERPRLCRCVIQHSTVLRRVERDPECNTMASQVSYFYLL